MGHRVHRNLIDQPAQKLERSESIEIYYLKYKKPLRF